MTQETTSVELEVTETSTETQARTYSQKEVDDMMAKTKTSVARKYEKKFEELGDIEELRKIKSIYEQQKEKEMIDRGEFEKVLQDMAAKKDAEIVKRDNVIREYKVKTPILSAAAEHRAINAEQVRKLLEPSVRLDADGEVEVIDDKGAVRYSDKGHKITVNELVKEFLDKNSHFVSPTPATTHTKSSVNAKTQELDVTKLNMRDPADRAKYAEYRKANGII